MHVHGQHTCAVQQQHMSACRTGTAPPQLCRPTNQDGRYTRRIRIRKNNQKNCTGEYFACISVGAAMVHMYKLANSHDDGRTRPVRKTLRLWLVPSSSYTFKRYSLGSSGSSKPASYAHGEADAGISALKTFDTLDFAILTNSATRLRYSSCSPGFKTVCSDPGLATSTGAALGEGSRGFIRQAVPHVCGPTRQNCRAQPPPFIISCPILQDLAPDRSTRIRERTPGMHVDSAAAPRALRTPATVRASAPHLPRTQTTGKVQGNLWLQAPMRCGLAANKLSLRWCAVALPFRIRTNGITTCNCSETPISSERL